MALVELLPWNGALRACRSLRSRSQPPSRLGSGVRRAGAHLVRSSRIHRTRPHEARPPDRPRPAPVDRRLRRLGRRWRFRRRGRAPARTRRPASARSVPVHRVRWEGWSPPTRTGSSASACSTPCPKRGRGRTPAAGRRVLLTCAEPDDHHGPSSSSSSAASRKALVALGRQRLVGGRGASRTAAATQAPQAQPVVSGARPGAGSRESARCSEASTAPAPPIRRR